MGTTAAGVNTHCAPVSTPAAHANWRRYNQQAGAAGATTAAAVSTHNTAASWPYMSSAGACSAAASASASYSSAGAVDPYIALLTEQLNDEEYNSSKRQRINGFQITVPPTDDPCAAPIAGSIMNDVEQTSQHAIWEGLTQQWCHTIDTAAAAAAADAAAAVDTSGASTGSSLSTAGTTAAIAT
jgi:hypothetical protein